MITVTVAAVHEREAILRRLLDRSTSAATHDQITDALAEHCSGESAAGDLLVANLSGEPCGAAAYVLRNDGARYLFPPIVADEVDRDAVCDAILTECCRRIDDDGASHGQYLLPLEDQFDRDLVTRHGFEQLTDILFLQRSLAESLPQTAAVDIRNVTYDRARNHERFRSVLETTYESSLDCPELHSPQAAEAALVNHRDLTSIESLGWTLIEHDARDAAVMLLVDHPDMHAWEVAYVGVIPDMRRRGIGREIVARAILAARRAARELIFVAVDSRNRYALTTYRNLGFVEAGRRALHVRRARAR